MRAAVSSAVLGLSSLALATCTAACTRGAPEPRVAAPEPEAVVAVAEAPPELVDDEVRPAPRPRLSQTITLGQGTPDQYTPSRGPAAPATPAQGGQTVIVNNNVVVNGGVPVYGYGFGGFGGAGYGGRGFGYGRGTTLHEAPGARPGGATWGNTGWEGARRTAAPGQTPGVGGNWAPAPSYGPAPMK